MLFIKMNKSLTTFDKNTINIFKKRCSSFPDQILPIISMHHNAENENKKSAAVLIPLCNYKGKPSILFTLRSNKVGTHKGQVSFPGGHLEKDETAVDAAIRETIEELGPQINGIEIVGICQTIPAITGV